MALKEWMMPQEQRFFDALGAEAENVLAGAKALRALMDDFSRIAEGRKRIKEIEHRGDVILKAAEQLRDGMNAVKDRKKDAVLVCTIEVNRLENLADDVLTVSLGELLKTGDPVRIIKLKEIYETLEIVTDRCEDVANILEDIVVKGR